MKTNQGSRSLESGNVLFVVVIITAILGLGLMGYLRLVNTQRRSVARSQAWNEVIPILEAGIEEALAQIARNTNASGLLPNNWVQDGNSFVKTRTIDASGAHFKARIIPSDPPVIESHGFSPIPLATNKFLERRVRVQTTNSSIFTKALVADGQIDLRGNDIETDSFDSSDPAYSTALGLYDPALKKDNGDVATNSGLTDSLVSGNANILGKVSTGYGGTVKVGSGGVVGDATWHATVGIGLQPSAVSNDMNVAIPVLEAPFTTGTYATSDLAIGPYAYVLANDNYVLPSLSLSGTGLDKTIYVTGNAKLYVGGNISLSGGAKIEIAPGASLTIYGAGETASFGGQGIVNGTGNASSFSYVGLESNEKLVFNGNSDFVGTFYAPKAALILGGGGSTTYDFVGAAVAKTITMNGHFNFHYDEALGKSPTPGFYTITAWNEY